MDSIQVSGSSHRARSVRGALITAILVLVALCAAPAAASGGNGRTTWTPLGPTTSGGPVRSIAVDPGNLSRIFAASEGGGIFRSTDAGASWQPVDDYLATLVITTIVSTPGGPNTIHAETGTASRRGAGTLRSRR